MKVAKKWSKIKLNTAKKLFSAVTSKQVTCALLVLARSSVKNTDNKCLYGLYDNI